MGLRTSEMLHSEHWYLFTEISGQHIDQCGRDSDQVMGWTQRSLEDQKYTWFVQVLRSPKEAFAAAMQSWGERCEKCVCLQGHYVEKLLHFQLPVVSSFFKINQETLALERTTSHDVRPSLNCRTHERTFFTSITPSLHVSLNCR